MPVLTGGCHCGRIRFEVDAPLERVTLCNCSICAKTAYLHWPVEPERVCLLTRDGDWLRYRFGTGVAEHRFCATCGISPFRIARSHPDQITINARCLDGVEAGAYEIEHFDGRHWEEAYRAERGHDGSC
jgi:hypothetical protein